MIAREMSASIGQRVGFDPLTILAVLSGLVQFVAQCRGTTPAAEVIQDGMKHRPLLFEIRIHRQCRWHRVPREKWSAVVDAIRDQCQDTTRLSAICNEIEGEGEDKNDLPSLSETSDAAEGSVQGL